VKYAVLGGLGQLGHDLSPRLRGDVSSLARSQLDVTDPESVRSVLQTLRPDVVINCAAYNFVDRAESEPDAAFAVNARGVESLARVCRDLDCLLVHFSTDYVFGSDEARNIPYAENDEPGPISVYGKSKLAGENYVRLLCPRHFVIRTCGLYGVWGSGGKGGNCVETMLRLASAGKQVRVVDDQICTPSYTVDVASAIAALILTDKYGIYHITNSGSCSWYDFAQTIFELACVKADLTSITSREYGAPARRPGYSVLATDKYAALGLPPLRPWRNALAAYLQERRKKG